MDNKTFRKEQLEAAGWSPKTLGSVYWHRGGISLYENGIDDAYESELLFPEKVRQAFLKSNPLFEFADRKLNSDATNTRIAERDRQQLENIGRDILEKMVDVPQPAMHWGWTEKGAEPLTPPRPRYKIATLVNGYAIVDNTTGRSIDRFVGLDAWKRSKTCLPLYNRLEENINNRPVKTTQDWKIRNEWHWTADNLDAEIKFLQKAKQLVETRNLNTLKYFLPLNSERAKVALYRFFAVSLLHRMGIQESEVSPKKWELYLTSTSEQRR